MKITVMGLGYIGLPTAITLAEAGFEVCGFDVNKKTIETLQGGHIHIVEPGLQEAFEKAVAHGHLHFSEKLGKSDVFYISVPTPFFKDENGSHKADLRFVSLQAVWQARCSSRPIWSFWSPPCRRTPPRCLHAY